MAITFSIATPPVQQPTLQVPGIKMQLVQLTYSGTYVTGGDALTAAQLGVASLANIQAVFVCPVAESSGSAQAWNGAWNPVTSKFQVFGGAATTTVPLEAASGSTLTGLKLNLLVFSA